MGMASKATVARHGERAAGGGEAQRRVHAASSASEFGQVLWSHPYDQPAKDAAHEGIAGARWCSSSSRRMPASSPCDDG